MGLIARLSLGIVSVLTISLSSACSQEESTPNIRATLFLLDSSKSLAISVSQREQQLRNRLTRAFDEKEAIYFDFVRNNYSKQVILPLISMQTIVRVNDEILNYAKDERVQKETKELVSEEWSKALLNSKTTSTCINDVTNSLDINSVLAQGSRVIAQSICISAEKAKSTFTNIKSIGSGVALQDGYIGSDIEGAVLRGLGRLESDSRNLFNRELKPVGVKLSIVISSDMMQRGADGEKIIDAIDGMTEEEIEEFINRERLPLESPKLVPSVKIDGWLSTKRNLSESDRQLIELYWKKWFQNLNLDEPDFGFGVMDWSVDI